jgi:hypothetical protein
MVCDEAPELVKANIAIAAAMPINFMCAFHGRVGLCRTKV